MGFEVGGRADKLGNRYEGRWVAKQLLLLLSENIASVTVEAIGDDEYGVDLWIEKKDGLRSAHQCKARNSSKEKWTSKDLTEKNVLQKMKFQLDRNPTFEFVFVSPLPATNFGDICDSARNSNGNAEDFYQFQILSRGYEHRKEFEQFCKAVDLSIEDATDLSKAFDYLRRIKIEQYSDSKEEIITLASFLLKGGPETIISTLCEYAEEQNALGKSIYVDELRKFLVSQDIHLKNLTYDERIAPAIEKLQIEFIDSIKPRLIGGDLIPRNETEECLDAIENNNMVVLHGSAGSGKSGVLYELTCQLQKKGIPWLSVRLDRRTPENTARHFGIQIGLPESPVECLVALARNRPCVLILDQLDALRWTCAHTSSALDVCKEIVRQVITARRNGKLITVILACRTYDLKNDVEIKNWINSKEDGAWVQTEVKNLPEELVFQVVGTEYHNLSKRQKLILSFPQNLAMWVELIKEKGNMQIFKSATELMRYFWEFKKSQLEKTGVQANDIEMILGQLVDWLEQNGKISAPIRIVSRCSKKALTEFKSFGILQEENNCLSFCHQSYLDFLIAENLLEQIESGGCILDWLGSRDRQSLFRREQLRQALAMIAEESVDRFITTTDLLLTSKNVRFHLKHLVLELIGQTDDYSSEIYKYCFEKMGDSHWETHIFQNVFCGNVSGTKWLISEGIIDEWLYSDSNEKINKAFWILDSVISKIPDDVVKLLWPLVSKGREWLDRINNLLGWKISKDSKEIFELRLCLARHGVFPDDIQWNEFYGLNPTGFLELTEIILSSLDVEGDTDKANSQKTIEMYWDHQDIDSLLKIAEQFPEKTWDLLMPHVERLVCCALDLKSYKEVREWGGKRYRVSFVGHVELTNRVVQLLIRAGKTLAQNCTGILMEKAKRYENSCSLVVQEILIEVFSALPKHFADEGIQWLLNDHRRFRLGDGESAHEWEPARRLIKELSPHCSENLFKTLEDTIVNYHDPDENWKARYYLKDWKYGYFSHYWGKTQFLLLPALAPKRISKKTINLINVLKRKFAGKQESDFLRRQPTSGGMIGSKPDKNLELISDKAWVNIIKKNQKIEDERRMWKQVSYDFAVKSSIRQFSSSLGKIATKYPERFGQLALQFPVTTNNFYISAIFDAMALAKPPMDLEEETKCLWEPASLNTIIAVVDRFDVINHRDVALYFCRMLRNRASENWPDNILEKLNYLAVKHPDLEPEKLNFSCDEKASEASVETLVQNTINCVRGVAALAICQVIQEHPEWASKFEDTIEILIRDQHPVVRMATIETLYPILNYDCDKAIEYFCITAKDDPRVPASPDAVKFFSYTVQKYHDKLTPIVQSMINSSYPDVVTQGARIVTAYYLFYNLFEDELKICIHGSEDHRKGVAEVAAMQFVNENYSCKCRSLMDQLMNDTSVEVKRLVSTVFGQNKFDLMKNYDFVLDYIKSASFEEDSFWLMTCLEEHKDSLIPFSEFILEICELLAEDREEASKHWGISSDITPLLLRIYEQAQNNKPEIASRCLDIWDSFFEKRIGNARSLTAELQECWIQ